MEEDKFTILCKKCGSNDVFLTGNHDGNAYISCLNCGESEER